MSTYFLAAPLGATPPKPRPPREVVPKLVLESMDGLRRIPLDNSTGWKALAGATGLDMPPVDVITDRAPGIYGSAMSDARIDERSVFIPIRVTAPDQKIATHYSLMASLRELVDPLLGQFRVVAATAQGQRELTVVYTGGLEGEYGTDVAGLYWRKFGLTALACDPFAHDRVDRQVDFEVASTGTPFLGVVGGTDAPWPRMLSSAAVIGPAMQIEVRSEVPVYPTLELTGPMDAFTGTLSPVVERPDGSTVSLAGREWSVSVPQGVPANSTLRIVTDPRAKSIRMDGALAAGRVARGSTLRPFYPGLNVLSVAAPGGTSATRVRLSWREAYRSLW